MGLTLVWTEPAVDQLVERLDYIVRVTHQVWAIPTKLKDR
jgi:hypothetical protein